MAETMQSLDQLATLKPATAAPETPKYVQRLDKHGRAYAAHSNRAASSPATRALSNARSTARPKRGGASSSPSDRRTAAGQRPVPEVYLADELICRRAASSARRIWSGVISFSRTLMTSG